MNDSVKIVGMLAAAMAGLTLLAYVPVISGTGMQSVIVEAFGLVCHQQPYRMFQFNGSFPAICSRCTGIYTGIALGLVVVAVGLLQGTVWSRGRVISAIAILTVITGADIILQWAGVYEGSHLQRSFLGLIWGIGIVSIILTHKQKPTHGT